MSFRKTPTLVIMAALHTATQEELIGELQSLLAELGVEKLRALVPLLRAYAGVSSEAITPPNNAYGEPLVSFDADGKGYTAGELGDLLDARVARMERGEGVLTLEEFSSRMNRFWDERA